MLQSCGRVQGKYWDMTWFLILKFLAIIVFLIMFLRRPSLVWGIGLLTVTTAVLLDTLLGTFDSQALQSELGFFYFVIAGMLFAGAVLWLWGLLLPYIRPVPATSATANIPEEIVLQSQPEPHIENEDAIDRQMLYQEIQQRFDREDLLDLMFDLEISDSDVMTIDQNMNQLIINIMDFTQQSGRGNQLALAVERILTPPPVEHLPRLEKINADSPPTVLRQYILAYYSLDDLRGITTELGIDWEQLDEGAKREKTRSLLQYAYSRNRIDELLEIMHLRGQVENV